jgi:hypothetical protein
MSKEPRRKGGSDAVARRICVLDHEKIKNKPTETPVRRRVSSNTGRMLFAPNGSVDGPSRFSSFLARGKRHQISYICGTARKARETLIINLRGSLGPRVPEILDPL